MNADECFTVRQTEDGFQVVDARKGEVVAWALERWMAEHWATELTQCLGRRRHRPLADEEDGPG